MTRENDGAAVIVKTGPLVSIVRSTRRRPLSVRKHGFSPHGSFVTIATTNLGGAE